jgi:hypothetical protein
MARKKVKPEEEADPFASWRAIQLTPEQKAAARAELAKLGEEARRNGVYERIRELRGKVHLDMDDLRKARNKD